MVKSIISALLLLLCVGSVVNAEQISLKNGDRLTGSIVSLDGKKLVLKTIYAGEVSIDWDSVEQFTSDQPLVLSTVDKKTVTGTVRSEGPDYVVTTTQGAQTMAKSDIAVIRSLADQAAYDKSLHPGILAGAEEVTLVWLSHEGIARLAILRLDLMQNAKRKRRPGF